MDGPSCIVWCIAIPFFVGKDITRPYDDRKKKEKDFPNQLDPRLAES